ncbi:hypothetical protein BCR42DRAFT_394866 [Absidia repens]|uniref:Uncharacterized protein n=1 Tax=Absidia repens TaxID=90262 RepID=A0A1X2IA58_9FUNG|nr:hypothetical protein BCR42DRAFT_394866 [Absidia repens]
MNSTYPTPPVSPANPIDSEPWSDDWLVTEDLINLTSKDKGEIVDTQQDTTWHPNVMEMELLSMNIQLTKTALDKFSQAHWEKKNALEVELVPRLIELIHQIFKPRPTPEAYRELARSFIHATLNQEQQSESFRPIWREINVQDPWLQAGGPASSGLADVDPIENMGAFISSIFGISSTIGWAMQ